jgi:dienelactone hydrolase
VLTRGLLVRHTNGEADMRYRALRTLAVVASAAVGVPLAAADTGPSLPKPTGDYPVGRATYHLADPSRRDERGSHKDRLREFMVHVWYPARPGGGGKPAAWLPPGWARLEGNNYGDLLKKSPDPAARDADKFLASVVVHSREDAPPADSPKRFPVVLLSPGSISFPSKYSSLAEDLASHGFVVVGNVPTGSVLAVSFPAGNVTRVYRGRDMFAEWTGDLIHELDQLAVWNKTPGHLFFGRLDLDRVGAFGHSAGGMIVSRIPHLDRRVKAVALLDPGMVRPEDAEAIPTLILKSERSDPGGRKEESRAAFVRRARPGLRVTLLGAEHASFTDLAVIPAFARPGDGKAFIGSTRAVLREFFGQYLSGKRSELLERGSAAYPLLRIEARP